MLAPLLVFAGWALAILPGLREIKHVLLITALTVLGLALFAVPASLDILRPNPKNEKRSRLSMLVSVVPALILFIIVLVVVPASAGFKAAAAIAEVIGLMLFGFAETRVQGTGTARDSGGPLWGRDRGSAAG